MAEAHHISRIDIEPSAAYPRRHPTHGWQVRVRRGGERLSRFFADARHGGRDGAFDAACAHRDELLAAAPDPAAAPRTGTSNTSVVGLSVREREDGRQVVHLNWMDAEGARHSAQYAVERWGLRKALWNGCLKLYRERTAAGRPVEEPHVMFARAQEPFAEQLRAEQQAQEGPAAPAEPTPEQAVKEETDVLKRLEDALFRP